MKIIRYLAIFFLALVLGIPNINASANTIDLNKKGNLSLTLKTSDSEYISNAEITIYQIGIVYTENSNMQIKPVSEIETCNLDFSKIEKLELTSSTVACIKKSNVNQNKGLTDNNGSVKFNNLELGVYLIAETKGVEGYSNIDPFLVIIPEVIDNKWNYDITSEPKTDIYRSIDLKVTKIWNIQSQNSKIPNSIIVELYNKDILIDTIELNKDNNWTYTWKDIEKSDSYNVVEKNVPKGFTVTYHKNEYNFIITNTDELPNTGRIYMPIIILSALGISMIAIGIIIYQKESNEE